MPTPSESTEMMQIESLHTTLPARLAGEASNYGYDMLTALVDTCLTPTATSEAIVDAKFEVAAYIAQLEQALVAATR